ncbi:hypothetical protein F2Q70_00021961 [Brassica cretica]|uniref:Uncharacterized protein n=2 Tax=Brassica cretica TaxID=69181 RepID=A0A8S9HGN5_BRACR|nr:hypothetical protein F2Q70_00021961 [Brassica cretica]KAF2557189.1 hypothetical protein F2Q68_00015737 [Brassica cretica]KAF3605828.1 hypothetical protein DY000_02048314 [Brassica cretica]
MSIPSGYISIPTGPEPETNIRLRNQASIVDCTDFIVFVTTWRLSRKANHGDCTFSNISGQILELTRNENRDVPFGEVGIGGDVNSDRSFVSRNGTESLRTPGLPPTLICSRRNFSSMEISMFLSSTGLDSPWESWVLALLPASSELNWGDGVSSLGG